MTDLRLVRGTSPDGAVQADDVETCVCGSAWFELRASDPLPHGAVAIDAEGRITARHGQLHCVECGETWIPRRARVRAVESDGDSRTGASEIIPGS